MNIKKQVLVLSAVLMALAAVIIAAVLSENAADESPVRIGLTHAPYAYCSFSLLANKDSLYTVSVEEGTDEIISALTLGSLDAALLPAEYLGEIDTGEYTVLAVTSYMNLVTIENGRTVFSISDLSGHSVRIPESLRSTPELRVFMRMAAQANVSADFVFEPDDSLQRRVFGGEFDIMTVTADQCASILQSSSRYRSCFNLSSQWSLLFTSQPPAGSFFVMRTSEIEEKPEAVKAILSKIRDSTSLINSKRKKAALLIAANGFGDSTDIWNTIPHASLVFLEDEAMMEALDQAAAYR